MIRVGVLGAKGYTAGEALRWLVGHPEAEIACLMARVDSPEPVDRYFPLLRGLVATPIEPIDVEAAARRCDAVILALPHTTAHSLAPSLVRAGVKVFDLSADFRFDSVALFEATYGVAHQAPDFNGRFVYALPELFESDIRGADALACPGCYPTAVLLALAPLLKQGDRFDLSRIVVNALSGMSGAGRKVEEALLFTEVNDQVDAYGLAGHRHRPEIEEKATRLAGGEIRIAFTPHHIPMTRGILATITVPLNGAVRPTEMGDLYATFYRDRPFIRLLPSGVSPRTSAVAMTNFCDLGFAVDTHSRTLIVLSALDNLAKGAASQAIQAMNLVYGLPETLGLLPTSARGAAV